MDSGLIMGLITGVVLTLIIINYLKMTKNDSASSNDSSKEGGAGVSSAGEVPKSNKK